MIVLSERAFRKKVRDEILKLEAISTLSKEGVIEKHGIMTKNAIQSLVMVNKKDGISSNIIKPIILDACIRSEKMSGKSGDLCLNLILSFLPQVFQNVSTGSDSKEILSNLSRNFNDFFDKCRLKSNHPTANSLKNHISQLSVCEISKDLIRVSFDLAGKSKKVIVEKTSHSETSITVSEGCTLPFSADVIFFKSSNRWDGKNVKCCIVDGIVLEVSEIHHLLEEASENKLPYVIFARDFSPEVLQTISYNFLRGTIDVLPIKIPMSEETINSLVDIAIICGSDVISSIKGDLISAAVKNELIVVEEIVCTDKSISILNNKTRHHINSHISDLQNRMHLLTGDDNPMLAEALEKKRKLMSSRIKTLITASVTIRVGNTLLAAQRDIVEQIDTSLREIKSHSLFGYIAMNIVDTVSRDSDNETYSLITEAFHKTYERQNTIPLASIYASLVYSLRAIQSLCSVGCVLFYSDT